MTTPNRTPQGYLPRGSNFDDIPLRQPPSELTWGYQAKGEWVLCPLCKGHGRWNLELNAYGPQRHFQGACNQCNGWGYVDTARPQDLTCIHDYQEVGRERRVQLGYSGSLFRGEHVWECRHRCGAHKLIDSSD